jgi:hypothetical protein
MACFPNTAAALVLRHRIIAASSNSLMQTINRFLYGPTPEERARAWQGKLRQESRVLDREMRQVWLLAASDRALVLTRAFIAGYRDQ